MRQVDFIGAPDTPPQPHPFVRNTRPSVAEEKAALCLVLGRLCLAVPSSVKSASVEKTREWLSAQKVALATAKNARSSIAQLTAAISNMRRFE